MQDSINLIVASGRAFQPRPPAPRGAAARSAASSGRRAPRGKSAWLAVWLTLWLIAGVSAQTVFVPTGATWRYLDTGTDQGTAWRQASFDDSAWASGPAELGYGDGGEATVVSGGPNSAAHYITTYFRHSFSVGNPADFGSLLLELLRDDGAVVYLNGVEILRSNMPGGTVSHTTLASTNISGTGETTFLSATLPATNLAAGTNQLAVEIHQNTAGSTDISFNLRLTGQSAVPTISPVQPAAGATGLALPPTLSVLVTDPQNDPLTVTFFARSLPGGSFSSVGSNTGAVSGQPSTFSFAAAAAGTSYEWYATVSDGAASASTAARSFTTNFTPIANSQSLTTLPATTVAATLTASDVESHYATLADYAQQQFIGTLSGVPSDLSGGTWDDSTGTLFMIRNDAVTGAAYEYSTAPTLLRTLAESGFVDTEAIAWMGGTRFAVAEENNNQRITLCNIAPTDTTLSRTAPGNVTWTTPVGNSGNSGIESLSYDFDRDVLYYCAEKPFPAGHAMAGQWPIFAMNPATGVSTVLCQMAATVFAAGVATDLSDMAHDRHTDTFLLLSDESKKIVRLSRTGAVLETKSFSGFTQPEGLVLSTDGRQLWILGEPQQYARFALPTLTLSYSLLSQPQHGTLLGLPPALRYVPAPGFHGTDSFQFQVSDGLVTSAPATVTVSVNAPPTVAGDTGPITVSEGAAATRSGTFSDPDGNGTVTLAASIGAVTANPVAGTWTWQMTPTDGPAGPATVTITATDDGAPAAVATTSFSLRVENVAPSFEAGADAVLPPSAAGVLARGPIAVSDPGDDAWTATVDWGDGSAVESLPVTGPSPTLSLNHVFTSEGTFAVAVTVSDDDGGSLTDGFAVDVTLNTPPTLALDSPGEWQPMTSAGALVSTGDGRTLNGSWFASDAEGWMVGQEGVIRRTLDGGGRWTLETSGTQKSLNSLWGADATHVWAVGDGGTILFWNGSAWSGQASGTSVELRGVWGTGPSDVWVVGATGTVLRWNGSAWTAQASGTTADFRAISGTDASHIWAVGGAGTVRFFNGSTWATQPSGSAQNLNGVFALAASNVWVAGNSGTILRFDGSAWSAAASGTTKHLRAAWAADPNAVWVVGYTGTILKKGATNFAPQVSGTTENLNTVCGRSTARIAAGGYGGNILTTADSGTTWTLPIAGTSQELRTIWGTGPANIWTAGLGGTVLHWDGTAWTTINAGTTQSLLKVWGTDASHVWAVGGGGTIRYFNGTTWAGQSSGATQSLTGLWGSDPANVWLCGWNGSILKWDGSSWSPEATGTTENLFGLWGTGPTDIWAVGNAGTILHYDGSAWSPVDSGTTAPLFDIWGAHGNAIWAVGASGTVVKWNGSAWTSQPAATTTDLRAVAGLNDTAVWTAGLGGVVSRWNGVGWMPENTHTTTDRRALWFFDAASQFSAGASGLIQQRSPGPVGSSPLTLNEGGPGSQTGTFNDADGRLTVGLSATKGGSPFGNVVRDSATGAWAWNPPVNLSGPADSGIVTVTAADDLGETASVSFALTVKNVAPTAIAQLVSVTKDTRAPITVTGSDPGLDSLSFTVTSLPTHGLLRIGGVAIVSVPTAPAGPTLEYTPAAGYAGADSFKFTVKDIDGAVSDAATVSIAVSASLGGLVADAPPVPASLAAETPATSPALIRLSDHTTVLFFTADPGCPCLLERSHDLIHWDPVATTTADLTTGQLGYHDPAPPRDTCYYRLVKK